MPEADDTQRGAQDATNGKDPPAGRREVPLDEAISIAILFQKNEQLAEAERVYRQILAVVPNHPVALHFAGVLAHQQGRTDEGLALIWRSLEADASQPDWYSNLGIVLRAEKRFDEAMTAFRRAIELEPSHANAHNNLGTVLRVQGRLDEAEMAYREALRLNPGHFDAYHNLGNLLIATERLIEGIECLNKAMVLSPEARETRNLLALAHVALGERDKAKDIYRRWLEEEPDNPVPRHMLAACSGEGVPERADDAYVEKVFDGFASSFDTKLAHLAYQAPQLVAGMLEEAGIPATASLDVLDAGCGTGLCGPLMRSYARRLVGVDLSAKMLEEARKRNVYDELCKAELTTYLMASPGAFDAVISADTLVYFGSLRDVIAAAASALRPRGWLIFTLEAAAENRVLSLGYELQTHGRYSHAREYLASVLRDSGFEFTMLSAELRMESGRPVAGWLVRAQKQAGNS